MLNSEKITKEIKFFESPVYNDILEKPCLFCSGENTTSVILDEKKHLITHCVICSGAHHIRICSNCEVAFADSKSDINEILDSKENDSNCMYCDENNIIKEN
ncbi:MAG: hypothetical protein ACHP65_09495 [Legionellales bacterium]